MSSRRWLTIFCLALASAGVPAQPEPPEPARLCLNCHVTNQNGPASLDAQLIPRLAGQQPKYLGNALRAYAVRERDHFFMRGIAAALKQDQLTEVVKYFSAGVPALKPKGRSLVARPAAAELCMSCHGDGQRPPVSEDIPRLAGQHSHYLKSAFMAYADGKRRHAVMRSVAQSAQGGASLSEADLEAVATWFASQERSVHGLR